MTAEELRAEARRLKQAAAASQKACQALSRVSGSPAVAARAEEFRCQRERLLAEIANLLEPALKCVAELEEANRKNSFGSASLLGALHTCMLNSVVETCRLNSKKPVEFIRNILASARDALPSIFLVPATG